MFNKICFCYIFFIDLRHIKTIKTIKNMKITIKEQYWVDIWEYLNNKGYIIYELDSYFHPLNTIHESDVKKLENEGKINAIKHQEHLLGIEKKRIQNKEDFKSHLKYLLSKKQKNISLRISGFPKFNEYLINYYKTLKEKSKIGLMSFIHNLYKDINQPQHFYKLAKQFYLQLSFNEFKAWLSYLPKNIIKISNNNNPAEDFINFIEQYFAKEDQHQLLYQFISDRHKLLTRTESKAITLRDTLLKFYEYDKEKINDYFDILPNIKMYIQSSENSNYLEPRLVQDFFYIEVNYEKMKAVLAIPQWKNAQYKIWINLILNKIYEVDTNMKKIRQYSDKELGTKHEYLSVYVEKHAKGGMTKGEVENMIMDFFYHLKNNYQTVGASMESKKEYMNKWYQMYYLSHELENKENLVKAEVRKI